MLGVGAGECGESEAVLRVMISRMRGRSKGLSGAEKGQIPRYLWILQELFLPLLCRAN